VSLGGEPAFPVFDGSNLWVPLSSAAATAVIRASSGGVLATLTGNGQTSPRAAAFDGERVLVTNDTGNAVSLWKAAGFTPLGSIPTGSSTSPAGACSDGINFWIALSGSGRLARF
jgi:DNA-binding beta-propeller fold protein YncE